MIARPDKMSHSFRDFKHARTKSVPPTGKWRTASGGYPASEVPPTYLTCIHLYQCIPMNLQPMYVYTSAITTALLMNTVYQPLMHTVYPVLQTRTKLSFNTITQATVVGKCTIKHIPKLRVSLKNKCELSPKNRYSRHIIIDKGETR